MSIKRKILKLCLWKSNQKFNDQIELKTTKSFVTTINDSVNVEK